MSKQILIDYEEYLELEECKNVLTDLKREMDWYGKIQEDPLSSGFTFKIPMPKSFKRYFSDNLDTARILKLIIQAEEV